MYVNQQIKRIIYQPHKIYYHEQDHTIANELNCTVQTVRNYFGGVNYQFGKNAGLHIEPGPDGGIVVLDDTTIYDMAVAILEEQNKKD